MPRDGMGWWFVSAVWNEKGTMKLQEGNPVQCCVLFWGPTKVMALSPKAWVKFILWPHAKMLPRPLLFCRKHERIVSVDCVACTSRIDWSQSRSSHQWIANDTLYNCVVIMFTVSIADWHYWCDDGQSGIVAGLDSAGPPLNSSPWCI